MRESRRERLRRMRDFDVSKLWMPSKAQAAFIESTVANVVFGGRRGPGKSIALLLDYREYAGMYRANARGALFRRTYVELEELILKGQRYFVEQLGWEYNGTEHTFRCVEGWEKGASLKLAHLRTLEDANIYAGHEYPWQGFDELGNWADPAPLDRLRGSGRAGPGQPTYFRASCMPGGPGHAWVKERYRPDEPYGIRKWAPLASRPDIQVETLFIPASLEDNPFVDHAEYERNLAAMANEKLFRAWRYGDWSIIEGAFFDCWDEDAHVLNDRPVYAEWNPKWIAADWGFSDDCVIGWFGQDEYGKVRLYDELKFNRTTPGDVGAAIARRTCEGNYGKQRLFALGPDAWAQRDSVHTIAEKLQEGMQEELRDRALRNPEHRDWVPAPYKADTDRKGGWMLMYQMLQSKAADGTPLFAVTSNCAESRRSIPQMQHDPDDPEDIEDSKVDHAPDMIRYGLKTFLKQGTKSAQVRLTEAISAKVELKSDDELRAMDELGRQNYMNAVAWASRLVAKKERSRGPMIQRRPYRFHRSRVGAL